MLLALLADLHANHEAVQACLAEAHARGAQRFAFLGDLVGYGADPGLVVDLVADYASRGAIVVKGNHDAAVAGDKEYLNEAAAAAVHWTRKAISPDQRLFLDALPLCIREEGVCYVHASAAAPERWTYVDSPGAALTSARAAGTALTLCGHVHEPALYVEAAGGRMVAFTPVPGVAIPVPAHRPALAVVGSVGQPRDGNTAASYAMLDTARRELTFHRVPYDFMAAARKIRAAGLPEILAYRLERGA